MAKSTLGKKNQTTVPREVREKLGIRPGDVLLWVVDSGVAKVRPATRAFLAWRGLIEVGPGSTVEDVRRACGERGALRADQANGRDRCGWRRTSTRRYRRAWRVPRSSS